MTSHIYSYNADCRQPDPEIWGGGVVGGPLVFSSNSQESFLRIYNKEITTPNSATGVISIYGAFTVKAPWVGITTHIVTGYIEEKRSYSYSGSSGIDISGSAVEKFISNDEIVSGSLIADIFSTEKITYDYNLDSLVSFVSEDDGLLSELVGETIDYGNILDAVSEGQEDYGNTEILSTTPSSIGTISLDGSGIYNVLSDEINTVLLTFSNALIESVSWNPPENLKLYENDISSSELTFDSISLTFDANEPKPDIKMTGSASNIFVSYDPPEGETNLTSSGQLIEKTTHHYNESSITIFEPETYGSITDVVSETFDYGFVSSTAEGNEDLGLIVFAETNNPFGTASFSGSAFVEAPDDIRTYGGVGAVYKVSYNPPENTASLFSFGQKSESISYNYSITSIEYVELESYDLITSPTSVTDDYGVVDGVLTDFIDYEGIDITSTTFSFGTLNLSGSASVEYRDINFYGYVTGAEVKVVYSPDDTSGTLFGFGDKVESVTYDYNLDSTREFVTEDLESISSGVTATDDYGLVTDIQTVFLDYGLTDDAPAGTTPFGLFNLTGSADSEYTNINFYGYVTGAEVKVVYSPDDTTGTLFGFGEKVESVAYDYSIDSIFSVGVPNYGSISDAATILEDYGIVSELHSQTEDNGSILGFSAGEDVIPFGSLTIFGYGDEKHVENYYVDGPTPIVVSSGYSNIQFISQTPEDTLLFTYNGLAIEKNTESYVGSGSLFEVGYITERTTYSYNLDSDVTYDSDSFGSISDSVTEISDYGQLISPISQGNEDFGSVILSDTTGSFGSILLFGESNNQYEAQIPEGTININVTGIKEERVTYIPPINQKGDGTLSSEDLTYDSVISTFDSTEQPDIKLTGSSEYSPVIYSEVGSGSLFNIGTVDESVTYDYNESSVLGYGIEDSGSVTDSVTSVVDYGSVGEVYLGEIDDGSVSDTLTLTPFGSINISGSANTEWINVNIYGPTTGAEIRVVYSPDDTTGTLFGFGEKLESVTYDYNEASALVVQEIDNGTVVDSVTTIEDYGFIDQIYVGEEDSGTIDTITSFAFGFLSITGDAGVQFRNANFFGPPEAIVRITYSPDDTSGTLFGFGEKLESVTYDYSEDSILSVGVPNYGSIDDPISIVEDYGFVYEIHSQSEDYQSLIDPATSVDVYPFGSLTILGSASIDALFEESFTGLFTVLGSAYTDYTPTYTSELATITISGSSIVRFTSSEVATDDVVISGTKDESRTRSYNESSILSLSEQLLDYGTLFTTTELSADYGSVAEIATENSEELGSVTTEITSTIYPFGTITISGDLGAPEIDYTPKYTAAGLITISGSALESETDDFGSDRRRGGNIRYCGDAETREIANYGYYGDDNDPGTSGSIFINGTLIERETDSYVGLGTIFVSDSGIESDAESYVGLGTATFSGTALEVYSAQTPENTQLFTFSGELNHPQIDYTPHYGIEKNIGIGTTGIQITELASAVESFSANTPEDTQLFQISGAAIERVRFDTPEDIQLFQISGTALESESESYVGIGGTLTLSDFGVEKNTESYVGNGIIEISGAVNDAVNRFERGQGSILIVNGFSPQESYPWLPEPGVGRSWSYTRSSYIPQGSINVSSGIALTHYYSPIYPRNSGDPGAGIGTIRINDDKQITFYRAVLPIFAKGKIYILGIGTAGNGDLDGVEFGAKESFTPATEIGTGLFNISGISATREINVYQGYQTGGLITISAETAPIIEKYTASWVGLGTIFVSDTLIERNTEAYFGTGTILAASGVAEAYSAQTPEDTATLQISGSAQESFVAQTPEDTILYQFSGAATDEKLIKAYEGSGSTILSGSANVTSSPAYPASGTIRFANTHHVDNLYDTCDSVDITSDEQDSAYVSFTANPPEDTVLFVIGGNAVTSETALYTEFVSGLYTLSGTYQNLKLTHSESGIGTIFITETSSESERDVYVGSGSLFTISGATEFYSAQVSTSTVVLQISGSAITSTEAEYSTVGIGLFTFNGTAITSEIATYTQTASGSITLSGQLVYPDIIFIPSPDGSGTINVLGSSDNSLTKVYEDTSGVLFTFSSGLESFTKSTYVGLGTVYIEEISGTTIDNPYQIPRTYVCII